MIKINRLTTLGVLFAIAISFLIPIGNLCADDYERDKDIEKAAQQIADDDAAHRAADQREDQDRSYGIDPNNPPEMSDTGKTICGFIVAIMCVGGIGIFVAKLKKM